MMSGNFGILSKLEFLQSFASRFISGINPAVIHNLEKYMIIKKVHYLAAIEDLEGDYLEFGVFTGSSFCHSIRCYRKTTYLRKSSQNMKFYGFDSFSGFGEIQQEDIHSFYTDENFETDKIAVEKRVNKVKQNLHASLIEGYFSDTLAKPASDYEIDKAAIIFVDSDTYASSKDALVFCNNLVQEGTYVILDDYYSYRGSSAKGVKKALDEFIFNRGCTLRRIFTYGMGGAVFVIDKIDN